MGLGGVKAERAQYVAVQQYTNTSTALLWSEGKQDNEGREGGYAQIWGRLPPTQRSTRSSGHLSSFLLHSLTGSTGLLVVVMVVH